MAKFVAYVRVSTERQGRSGLGLEAQAALISRHLDQVDGQLLDTVVEVESGSSNERPGLQRALALCRRQKAILIIARLDRLGRRLAFLAQLLDADVDVRVADNPGASKLTLQLLAVVAEAERDLVRDRTRQALAAAKARGTILGKHGKQLAQEATAAATALNDKHGASIKEVFAKAGTIRQAATLLNDLGVPTREGGYWGPSNTARLCSRLGLAVGMSMAERQPTSALLSQ